MIRKLMVAAFVLGLMAVPLRAVEKKVSLPVEVEANEMEIIDADKQAIFRGKVDAVRGDQHITSQQAGCHRQCDHHHQEANHYRRLGEDGYFGKHPACRWRRKAR
jgi:lipopolysaccharide export system protein LptA